MQHYLNAASFFINRDNRMLKKISFSVFTILALMGCASTQNLSSTSSNKEETRVYPETKAGSPLDQVYKTVEDFHDYNTIQISQKLSAENNIREATVTLIQEGWADDSVVGTRKDFKFRFIDGEWKQLSVDETQKCGRGADTTIYHKKTCP